MDHKLNTAADDSDVDDDIVQLACRMAYNMLEEGDDDSITSHGYIDPTITVCQDRNPNMLQEGHGDSINTHICPIITACPDHNPKPWGLCGSPQSTLKGFSFDGDESLPPPADDDGVANKFADMKLCDDESTRLRNNSLRFKKENQQITEQQPGRVRVPGGGGGRRYRVRSSKGQQWKREATSEVMTALFLCRPGSKAGSTFGTGVFLPPGAGGSMESRTKRGCSTALIPARVLQALKLSPQHLGLLSPSQATAPHQHYDQPTGGGRSGSISKSATAYLGERPMPEISHQDHEMGLPQEWTY